MFGNIYVYIFTFVLLQEYILIPFSERKIKNKPKTINLNTYQFIKYY